MTVVSKIVAIAILAGLAGGTANAHTQLSSSTPADQSVIDSAPDVVQLTFSATVRLTALSLQSGTGQQALDLEAPGPATTFAVALPHLGPGEYVLEWRALAEDTHVMTGEIAFTIAA